MACSVEYDTTTGEIYGVLSPPLAAGASPPSGRAFITQDSYVDASANKVDVTQNPPVLVPYTPSVDYTTQAENALATCDRVTIRCYQAGVAIPADWVAYAEALRPIAAGTAQGPLPTQPSYPAGT